MAIFFSFLIQDAPDVYIDEKWAVYSQFPSYHKITGGIITGTLLNSRFHHPTNLYQPETCYYFCQTPTRQSLRFITLHVNLKRA
jgi:hypothetical protein